MKLVDGNPTDFEDLTGYSFERVRIWIQYITPEWAKERLGSSNTVNRHEKERRIDAIARNNTVRRGYKFTGVPILFDNEWNILDGHHRLKGIVKSGKPAYLLVVWGLEKKDVIPMLDDIAIRTLGDRLQLEFGIENSKSFASVCVIFDQLRRPKDKTSWYAPTYPEIVPIFKKYRDDIQWVIQAVGPRMEPGCSTGGSPVMAAFAFCRPINPIRMDELAAAFHSGKGNENQIDRMRAWVRLVTGSATENKNPSTRQRHQRWTMTLISLGYIERALLGRKTKRVPKPEIEIVARLVNMRSAATAPR